MRIANVFLFDFIENRFPHICMNLGNLCFAENQHVFAKTYFREMNSFLGSRFLAID